ncbi:MULTISPECIES: fucose isomerase [unclassified Curtobacterium]|uniref:fucose isomerase n=1 Tax=unclassified Curtobacterium TaxID=257496 RepID=UPI000DA95776|nr:MULTISPECIES: fucose isomerase [unclassified Curtobacterium]PZE23182.1 fucose isomerase [Curtobacterium sp. MCBD17_028]PZE73893.1 fucose isomerase [Curtobacterium sp. MCBD17_019]PZF56408.1 fucose isomerase [Curtobacterium sp. MCBD17_034]PZM33276.1 fucose isomerase [Curtobacterium sp. MCBD17_031]
MTTVLPTAVPRPVAEPDTVYLVASGDLRESANTATWPTQARMEAAITDAVAAMGRRVVRALPVDPVTGHGLISSQRMGMEVFRGIPTDAPLVVAIAGWQYSHHVLAGLRDHAGPVLTVANFVGDWPGLVGLLGLNGGLTKARIPYSTLWSVDFTDRWFLDGLHTWLETGSVTHDTSHVHELPDIPAGAARDLGVAVADVLRTDKAIIGVFDEGCMGMYNAIIDDEVLNRLGVYKERLSQSALWAEMQRVPDSEADAVRRFVEERGFTFRFGADEATELTERQVRWQCAMYVAALRIADDFGLDAVGIQYQQGLKDTCPASDFAEGLLNDPDRPPVTSRDGSRVLYDGLALPHFNEADEGVAVDALVTNRVWTAMGLDPSTTLHDIRWGEEFEGDFTWVFEISGSIPPSHVDGGYAGAEGWRQDRVFFPLGGSTIRAVSKPGEIVWSRVWLDGQDLQIDIGRGTAVRLPPEESERRWAATNPEWPMMHAVLHGVSRDQLMARHRANHLSVVYAPDAATADRALVAKATAFDRLGVRVHLCGDVAV